MLPVPEGVRDMTMVRAGVFALALLAGGSAHAGGTFADNPYCLFVQDATELVSYDSIRALRAEVLVRHEHAAAVATDPRTIYSTSPLYVWASEAKVSCAQAYGYLRKPLKWKKRPNFMTVQKCECFYERMTEYLPRQ